VFLAHFLRMWRAEYWHPLGRGFCCGNIRSA